MRELTIYSSDKNISWHVDEAIICWAHPDIPLYQPLLFESITFHGTSGDLYGLDRIINRNGGIWSDSISFETGNDWVKCNNIANQLMHLKQRCEPLEFALVDADYEPMRTAMRFDSFEISLEIVKTHI